MTEESHDHESAAELEGGAKLVPVAEAIRYRRRAQQAESQVESFEQQLGELQSQVEQQTRQLNDAVSEKISAEQALVQMENRMLTEQTLMQAGAVDVEAAEILLSSKLDMNEKLTAEQITKAVDELLTEKSYMKARSVAPAMPGVTQSQQAGGSGGHLSGAAKKAAASGNRKDIAEYLRLRRQHATMP